MHHAIVKASQTGKSVLYSINDLSFVFDADVEIIRFCLIHNLLYYVRIYFKRNLSRFLFIYNKKFTKDL